MPIYEYVCRDCGHPFEWLARGDEKPACPSCGGSRLDKQLSATAAHASGSREPLCPARDTGSCRASDCGGCCGMG